MLKGFFKDTFIYGLGKALKKFVGLFLLPFYTHALSPSDFGVLESLGVFIFFVTAILDLGLNTGSARYYYQAPTAHQKGRVLYTAQMFRVASFLPAIVLAVFSSSISTFLFGSDKYTWAVFLSCVLIPVSMLNQEQANLLRYLRKPWQFNTVTLIRMLTAIPLGILLVVILEEGVLGAQLAAVLSGVVVFGFTYWVFNRKHYVPVFSKYWAIKFIRFGFPLIWASIALWFYQVSDRYLLLFFQNTNEVGLYSLAFSVSQVILVLNMTIEMSFNPIVLKEYEEEDDIDKPRTKKLITDVFGIYSAISVAAAVFVSIFSVDLISLISTEHYKLAALAVPGLLFSAILFQSRGIVAVGIGLKEKTKFLMWLLVITAIINVLLNVLWIPKYSFMGAAWSTLLASFIYFLMALFIAQKLFRVELSLFRTISYWGIAFAIAQSVPFLELNMGIHLNYTEKVLLAMFSCALPIPLGLFRKSQIVEMVQKVRSRV